MVKVNDHVRIVGGAREGRGIVGSVVPWVMSFLLAASSLWAQTESDIKDLFSTYPRISELVLALRKNPQMDASDLGQAAAGSIDPTPTSRANYRLHRALLFLIAQNEPVAKAMAAENLEGLLVKVQSLPVDPGESSIPLDEAFDLLQQVLPNPFGAALTTPASPSSQSSPGGTTPAGRSRQTPPVSMLLVGVMALIIAAVVVVHVSGGRSAPPPRQSLVKAAPVAGVEARMAATPAKMAADGGRRFPVPDVVTSLGQRPSGSPLAPSSGLEISGGLRDLPEAFKNTKIHPPATGQGDVVEGDGRDPNARTLSMVLDRTQALELSAALEKAKNVTSSSGSKARPVQGPAGEADIQGRRKGAGKHLPGDLRAPLGSPTRPSALFAKTRRRDRPVPPGTPEADPDLLPSRYEQLSVLGRGGMGVVYRALDREAGREVAIKTLALEVMETATVKERFVREYETLLSLDHPNIVKVYDIGVGRLPFFVMEYVDGEDLGTVLVDVTLPERVALDVTMQVADALDYAHGRGILHRDIKPSNLMLAPDGRVKIVDFGLVRDTQAARLTIEGTVLGSLRFMAPEQLMAKEIAASADLYAAGATLFYLLAGQTPFEGKSPGAKITQEAPPLTQFVPEVSPALSAIVARCIRKDPKERYRTARDLREALRSLC